VQNWSEIRSNKIYTWDNHPAGGVQSPRITDITISFISMLQYTKVVYHSF